MSNLQSSSLIQRTRQRARGRQRKLSVAQLVHQAMNSGPAKFVQAFNTEVALVNATNPVYWDFPNPTPGAQENSRLGNSIKVKEIRVHAIFNNNSTASSNGMLVRMAILEVKSGGAQGNSSITTQLFEPSASGSQDTTAYLDIRDISATFNREIARVLYDEVIVVSPSTAASTNAGIATINVRMPYSKLWRYQDGDASDPSTNRLTVLLMARDAANDGAAITVEASGTTSFLYHDQI